MPLPVSNLVITTTCLQHGQTRDYGPTVSVYDVRFDSPFDINPEDALAGAVSLVGRDLPDYEAYRKLSDIDSHFRGYCKAEVTLNTGKTMVVQVTITQPWND